jgi:predicted deacetylase
VTARWLRPVVETLDAADRPCRVFFRDDDAGWDTPRLGALLDQFDRHGTPIDLAVIPTEITPPLARELVSRAAGSPVRLHQHGYAHADHERAGRKCEFGPARTRAEQQLDIGRGRERLIDAFGAHLDPVFTPPWNRCTDDTADALLANGIEVLSRDHTAARFDRQGLTEVPVTVDWFGHRKGTRWTRHELALHLAASLRSGRPLGVMLHHAVCNDAERRAIGDLLAVVDGHPAARPTTIVELAAVDHRVRHMS